MKKIICFILILLFIPCSFSFAFGGEGLYDIAYPFDENGNARVVLNEKWGVIDLKGENVLPFEYEYISECKGGLIKVKKNSLFGFLDEDLGEVISPIYKDAKDFNENFSCVMNEEGKWGYVGKNGEKLTDFLFDDAYSFSDGLARVLKDGKYGYIGTDGEIKIEPSFTESYDFSCGLAAICTDGKWGYIGQSGKTVVPAIYDAAWDFSQDLAAVKSGELWSFIDTSGETVIKGDYDRATHFSDGLAPVRKKGGMYGLIDASGNLKVSHKFDFIGEFYEGLAYVRIGEKYGYINEKGLTVIPVNYERASDFSNGYALVGTSSGCGYIDKNGVFVSEKNYIDGGKFTNGYAGVRFENGLWGYTDFSKKPAINEEKPADDNENDIENNIKEQEETTPTFSPDIISNNANVIKLKIGDKNYSINGKEDTLHTAPFITDGRTLLPIRAIVEAAGGKVKWDAESRKVSINYDGGQIILQIGSKAAKVNGKLVPLEVSPEIKDDSTVIPLRFVAERLSMGIKWDEKTSEITLYY